MSYCSNYYAVKGKKLFDPKQKEIKWATWNVKLTILKARLVLKRHS